MRVVSDKNRVRIRDEVHYSCYVHIPKKFYPGVEARVEWCPCFVETRSLKMVVSDGAGKVYENQQIYPTGGRYVFRFVPRGRVGEHTMTFTQEDGQETVFHFMLSAETILDTEDENLNFLMRRCREQALEWWEGERRQYRFGECSFYMTVPWIRDNAHILKASRYWETADSLKNWINFFLEQQREDGMLFEKMNPFPAQGIEYQEPDCWKLIGEMDGRTYVIERLEIEADVEYLMVQAAYHTWQATGDDAWMESILPKLDKAMSYIRKDKKRWHETSGLAMRPNTLDTWDFAYGPAFVHRCVSLWWDPTPGRRPNPMCIFHGDNTGFYQAGNELAEMYRHIGNTERANYWGEEAKLVRERLMAQAWNGRYFSHMLHIAPTVEEAEGVDRENWEGDATRFSMSNAYALNRGFFTQEEAEQVIETYKALRDNPPHTDEETSQPDDRLFAEWVTLFPPYRKDRPMNLRGRDVNGTLSPFCGGELAMGTYRYGYEAYGWDIIKRFADLCVRDGMLWFLYGQNGRPHFKEPGCRASNIGPDPWGTAAVYVAILEGLAGVRDQGEQMQRVLLQPAWTAGTVREAYVSASYGCSDNYVAYQYHYDEINRKITYQVVGDAAELKLSFLLPEKKSVRSVRYNGGPVEWHTRILRNSHYVELELKRADNLNVEFFEILLEE